MNQYFNVSVDKYKSGKSFFVYRPASLDSPLDNSVMFVTKAYVGYSEQLLKCKECLVFWPENIEIPKELFYYHAIVSCRDPRLQYCEFFKENDITNAPRKEMLLEKEGSWIGVNSQIGDNTIILPGCYISNEANIGNNVIIGSGVKIAGKVTIGNNVVVRENTVIGVDGLSTDRDEFGKVVLMPQFGGVVIEDNVQIGANTTIARGAIDNTIIHSGSKIDNNCFISHNVKIGKDTLIVGESIMFGSSSTGEQAYISGNATIRNGIHIGSHATVGMGAVVVKNVDKGITVKGNPAK